MTYVFGKSVVPSVPVVMMLHQYLLSVHTEVLFGLMVLLARWLGLHADNLWTCRLYTFLLLGHLPMHGFPCRTSCATMLRCFMWLAMMLLLYLFPLFPPKKKADAEKRDMAREELEQFVLEHGQMPSRLSELAESRSLYNKLQKLKLTHLLQHDWRKDVCQAVQTFYDNENRLPKRQNLLKDEKREEDLLAKRWDRLLTQKGSLPAGLLETYTDLFTSAEDEDGALATCVGVEEFFQTSHGLPKRRNGTTDAEKAENALAQRWDRLVATKDSLSLELVQRFSHIFEAASFEDDDGAMATCVGVEEFFQTSHRLPKRQNATTDAHKAEDALAKRWDRLVATKDSLSLELLQRFSHIFQVGSAEDDDGALATCLEVQDFLIQRGVLPKRQKAGVQAEKAAEEVLARRLARLLSQRSSLSPTISKQYHQVFEAAAGRCENAEKQGLANFLDDISVLELFAMCGSLGESQVQRFIDSSLNEFKAGCVAWLLARCEAGDEELTGVCMDGLDEWDDTSAVREELRQYVIASGQLYLLLRAHIVPPKKVDCIEPWYRSESVGFRW